jgi:hypothetical protein
MDMEADEPVKAYKALLSELIDRRPSGTRQRIADALGKHRSFVTQITSTTYATPLPAKHIPVIFSVCHFNADEKKLFLGRYHAAHPEKREEAASGPPLRHMSLMVPELGNEEKNRLFDEAVAEFAHRMGALLGQSERTGPEGGNE